MDLLFLTPPTPLALPRAYWFNRTVNTQLVLISPSSSSFTCAQAAIATEDYDTDIINRLYNKSATILPHRGLALLTREFRRLRKEDHSNWLGNPEEDWVVDQVMREVKYIHFSDWPLPKVNSLMSSLFKWWEVGANMV